MCERPCYRALDAPVRILGLEIADWSLSIAALIFCLLAAVLLDLAILLPVPIAVWAALAKLRRGKTRPGYLRYAAYRSGLFYLAKLVFPELSAAPYMIPPVWIFRPGSCLFLSAHRVAGDGTSRFGKFFLNGRRWIRDDGC